MRGKVALLAPGQGAQRPGMLTPWLKLPGAGARLGFWSSAAGLDLARLGCDADEEEIRNTANTQPLLTATALLAGKHLPLTDISVVAGHSVGELAAAALAGVITPRVAVQLAARRGLFMSEACAVEPTGMVAVIGGNASDVMAAIARGGLRAANYNGAGQIVAGGPVHRIRNFVANPPARARVISLQVAGAFHTEFMESAEERFRASILNIRAAEPRMALLSNFDGDVVEVGRDMIDRLSAQISAPIRWDLCMNTLERLGVTAVIELPPAGALIGMIKRRLRDVETFALNTPDDLPAAINLIARHKGCSL